MYSTSEKKLLMLRPRELKVSPYQSRKNFDEYEMKLLADSISASGIIQPLSVRKLNDGTYELIAGERRLKAAMMAGLKRVPCILHKTDEETAALYSIIENLQRSNLTVFEEAEGINRLISEYGMPQSEAAERLGIAQSTLSNKLRLLRLNDTLRKRIIATGLTERHARALLRLPEESRVEVLDYIIVNNLSSQETEEYVLQLINPLKNGEARKETKAPIRKAAIGDVRLFSNSLSKLVDTLQNAGIDAKSRKYENEEYIEFKVRIQKNTLEASQFKQLKIC